MLKHKLLNKEDLRDLEDPKCLDVVAEAYDDKPSICYWIYLTLLVLLLIFLGYIQIYCLTNMTIGLNIKCCDQDITGYINNNYDVVKLEEYFIDRQHYNKDNLLCNKMVINLINHTKKEIFNELYIEDYNKIIKGDINRSPRDKEMLYYIVCYIFVFVTGVLVVSIQKDKIKTNNI